MINQPTIINQRSFQLAWKEVLSQLSVSGWALYNLVVQISNPTLFEKNFHQNVSNFCDCNSLLGPKHVAYTIFPHELYRTRTSPDEVFLAYNRAGGLYQRLRRRPRSGWGTYFRRMTNYETTNGTVNQLRKIIQAINDRQTIRKAAYTILIQNPGGETIRPLGGPCLNYLAIQLERTVTNTTLGLLCVYRNHDFLERAYGNYWGLCNLTRFLANETGFNAGPVTCISSHCYVERLKTSLQRLLEAF